MLQAPLLNAFEVHGLQLCVEQLRDDSLEQLYTSSTTPLSARMQRKGTASCLADCTSHSNDLFIFDRPHSRLPMCSQVQNLTGQAVTTCGSQAPPPPFLPLPPCTLPPLLDVNKLSILRTADN